MAAVDPLTFPWSAEQVTVMQGLRDWAAGFTELNQHLAAWMRLPGSDANALGHIIWAAESGAPLSPAQLSRLIGMSSGATTVLLNRLETAGHIRRSRESADRRRVTLRALPEARDRAQRFLGFAGAEVAAVLRATDPDDLRTATAFLARLTAATGQANQRLTHAARRRAGRGDPTDHPGASRAD